MTAARLRLRLRLRLRIANRVPSLLLAALLLLGTALVAGRASAGTLQIRDEARLLAGDDAARLRATLADAPFDGRLVFTSSYPDAQELSRYVASLMSEPDMVVVGVDPQHHHVQVHFGTGSRIPSSAWPAIERAGNDAFRRGDWESGAAAIFREASRSVAAGGTYAPGERATPAPSGPGFVLLVVVAVVGIGLVAAFLLRRRGVSSYPGAGPSYGPPYGGGPVYPGGGYGYGGAPPQGGMGPIGGGLIGAGLGGLAGYELGKLEGEREERDREDRSGGVFGGDDDRGGGDFDAGGGGSDWDDGGGGGGFDGGGGDGGGGGSDF
jgi:hypothetical protein